MRGLLIAGLLIVLSVSSVPLLPAAGVRADGLLPQCWLPLIYGPLSATPTPTRVRIAPNCSHFNALGNDNHNLNDEYVCFENYGSAAADMSGWRVRDETAKTYTFPSFVLPSKATVRLHTGAGSDTASDLYWGRTQAVWNNDGDTVSLYDASDVLVDQYRYEEALEGHGPTTAMIIP